MRVNLHRVPKRISISIIKLSFVCMAVSAVEIASTDNAVLAHPSVTILSYFGDWTAFYDSAGRICAMMNNSEDQLLVAYQAKDDHLSIQVSSPRWDVQDNAHYETQMIFDHRSAWRASGVGGHYESGAPFVDMDLKNIQEWMEQFMDSYALYINFPHSGIPAWSVSLAGTRLVSQPFARCVSELIRSS